MVWIRTNWRGLAAALLITSAGTASPARSHLAAQSQQPAPSQKLTFEGDIALWTVATKANRSADFETILAKLREGLAKSRTPTGASSSRDGRS